MTEKRNSNIELLRIVLILFVLILHFNGAGSLFNGNKINVYYVSLMHSLSICAVDCFMIISGYFMINNRIVKLSKIADLLFTIVLYNFIGLLFSVMFNKIAFSIKDLMLVFAPANYFGLFYIIIYVFSPYINKLFISLTKNQINRLILLLTLIFLLYPFVLDMVGEIGSMNLNAISIVSINGHSKGYSIINFFVCYCIGVYLRMEQEEINENIKTYILFFIFIISTLIMSVVGLKYRFIWNYCSVLVIINAITIFLIFTRINIKNSFINYISKSVFAIYCLHTRESVSFLWKKYFITDEHVRGSLFSLVLWSILSVIIMFLACLLIDLILRVLLTPLKNKLFNKLPIIINLKEEEPR